jgi:DNA anti-recombination protein RmuC
MVNEGDADLLANLQGLCNDPAIRLADILEQVPWGLVWESCSLHEGLANQHRRLTTWEKALARQLESLNQATERLKEDSRYGLWQQRQKDAKTWQSFLDEAAEQQREANARLTAELEELNEKLARMVKV